MSVTVDMKKIARKWKAKWEAARAWTAEAVLEAGDTWKKNALSPKAIQRHREETLKSLNEGRRERGLEKVSPQTWANLTASGIRNTTLTAEDMDKMASGAGPYISLIKEARALFQEIPFSDGIEAGKAWLEYVAKPLKKAKRNPDLIDQVRREIMENLKNLKATIATAK